MEKTEFEAELRRDGFRPVYASLTAEHERNQPLPRL